MEYINNKLVATCNDLEGVVSSGYLRLLTMRNKVVQVRRGGNGRQALFEVDSLPYEYREAFYRKHPEYRIVATAKPFVEKVEFDGKAYQYYTDYLLVNGSHLPDEQIIMYTNSASILNRFTTVLNDAYAMRSKTNSKRINMGEFWNDKVAVLQNIGSEMRNNLPQSVYRLRKIYKEYISTGSDTPNYEAIIDRRQWNNNAAKFKGEQEAIMLSLVSNHRNLDCEFIAKAYNNVAQAKGWKTISSRTVRNYLKKNETLTMAARQGSAMLRNSVEMQNKRKAASHPLGYWTSDGWKVELYYQEKASNGQTTYTNSLTVVIVLDAFNKYPIGYAIGKQENAALITEAYKNALDHTKELFAVRYGALQIQSDNYQIKHLTPMYLTVADNVTPATVGNAKAKIIEPYNNYLNKTYCRLAENWSGYGITSRKELQPNAEYLNKIRKNFPTREGVEEQIKMFMEYERASKREEYVKAFNEMDKMNLRVISEVAYLQTFGKTVLKIGGQPQTYAITASGITTTINRERISFKCFDHEFVNNTHLKWTIRYNENDLSQALAVSEDGRKVFELEREYIQPMAIHEQTYEDVMQLRRVGNFNKRMEKNITKQLAVAQETSEQFFLRNPDLDNSLAKHLIVSSTGQHKDQLTANRMILEATYGKIEVQDVEPINEVKKIEHITEHREARKIEPVTTKKKETKKAFNALEDILNN